MEILLVAGIVLLILAIYLYRKNSVSTSTQASAPTAIVQPAPVAVVLPQDNTGSLLDSPANGGYYSGVPGSDNTSPVTVTPTPVYQTPVTIPTGTTSPVYQTPAPVQPMPTVSPPKTTSLPAYNYIGCYADNTTRALPIRASTAMTVAQCKAAAASKGSAYFGMQWPEGNSGDKAQCWYGPGVYDRYGASSVCNMVDASGNKIGGYWANAVYRV